MFKKLKIFLTKKIKKYRIFYNLLKYLRKLNKINENTKSNNNLNKNYNFLMKIL